MHAMKVFAALTMLTLTSACAGQWSECAWSKRIIASPGWEERWTRAEKEQVLGQNENVKQFCR